MQTCSELILTGNGRIEGRAGTCARPSSAQVRAQVHVVGICATDMALHAGAYSAPHKTAICWGHEWSGVVEAVGSDVRQLRVGDRVTGECSLWCGECERCQRNKNLCQHVEKFGITVDGAARTHVLVDEKYLHRGEPDLDMGVLALTEPLAVSAQGIVAAAGAHDAALSSQRILVIGGGMIGLGCVLLLRRMFGCDDVFVHDIEPARMKRAQALGAGILTAAPATTAATDGYAGLYHAAGDRFDIVVETTGATSALQLGLRVLMPGGTLAMLGFLPKAEIAPKDLVIKAARIVGSIGGSGMFEKVVPWLAQHATEARALVSHSFPAHRAEEAFAAAGDRQNGLKVQVRFA